MENILQGIVEFRKHDFEQHKQLFEKLGRSQKPHTLFIGCSDSRVVPNLITRTQPGELFMVRNIANLVPLYREADEFLATTSVIEYAIQALRVENIIVCGHSNCGGCEALYLPDEKLANMPHTRKWLQLAHPVRDKVLALPEASDPAAREWLTEQMNVVEQMKHLLSYPFIREKYQKGELKIMGWYYIIETGEIFAYNKSNGSFELIAEPGDDKG
ncbi:carbonic anhydrase [Breznakibacter xylanolyticus]|uniref:Carbonic anhydrase n=1 Tax=Breznakibacter xylanolyticus TaxID=990 RepID=A0A2W7NRA7_9BACT|nr:carbonic anhydrase [Breznakibacter xylanolyticus]MBN2743032.1 carbonic anhydrase [Marinilabiliaceae bacterium]PZX13822.1 carbonic anhydrase [Breznakibacter xylanolyticus]